GNGVDHHIAGTGVEGNHILGKRARWNRSEISDAAEILHDAPVTAMAVEHVIEKRHKRCALAAGSHVGGTEIGNHRHSDLRRDNGRFAGLPGTSNAAAQEERWASLMIERLPMASDQFALQTCTSLRGADRVRIEFAKKEMQPRKIGDAGGARVHACEDGPSNIGRIGKLVMRQQFEARAEAAPLDAHQSDVDTVGRGAAHYARDDQSPSSRACIRTSSLNSQRLRRSLSTVFRPGAAAMRDFNARDFFFAASTCRDFSAMSLAHFLSLSACL